MFFWVFCPFCRYLILIILGFRLSHAEHDAIIVKHLLWTNIKLLAVLCGTLSLWSTWCHPYFTEKKLTLKTYIFPVTQLVSGRARTWTWDDTKSPTFCIAPFSSQNGWVAKVSPLVFSLLVPDVQLQNVLWWAKESCHQTIIQIILALPLLCEACSCTSKLDSWEWLEVTTSLLLKVKNWDPSYYVHKSNDWVKYVEPLTSRDFV